MFIILIGLKTSIIILERSVIIAFKYLKMIIDINCFTWVCLFVFVFFNIQNLFFFFFSLFVYSLDLFEFSSFYFLSCEMMYCEIERCQKTPLLSYSHSSCLLFSCPCWCLESMRLVLNQWDPRCLATYLELWLGLALHLL
jgi:hypothetical protein